MKSSQVVCVCVCECGRKRYMAWENELVREKRMMGVGSLLCVHAHQKRKLFAASPSLSVTPWNRSRAPIDCASSRVKLDPIELLQSGTTNTRIRENVWIRNNQTNRYSHFLSLSLFFILMLDGTICAQWFKLFARCFDDCFIFKLRLNLLKIRTVSFLLWLGRIKPYGFLIIIINNISM